MKQQILECSPQPLDGIPEGISALLRGCLEKDRHVRCQRMSFVLIELKLASASLRQAHSVSEWREKVLSLRSQVAAHDERLAAQQSSLEAAVGELRQAILQIDERLALMQEIIAGLDKGAQIHAKSIESLQVASAQTDEVVEHVVEAFGVMHKSMVERDGKVLLVARSGN